MGKMTLMMTPSERRRAYGLKRIVVSHDNYFALKRIGQAGDSFNDVISNLLLLQRNYQKEKERKEHQQQQLRQQKQHPLKSSGYDNNYSDVINEPYSASVIANAVEQDNQRIAELVQMHQEAQEEIEKQQKQPSNKRARK
jgi:predicted CopG family antitoxin